MDEKNDKLVLRDMPITLWVFGILCAAVGVYWYLQAPTQWIALAIGSGIFLLVFLFSSMLTVTADRSRGTLTLRYASPLRRKIREILIDDIASIELERSFSSSDSSSSRPTYRIVVVTKNNEAIPLRSYYTSGLLAHQRRIKRLRQFLNVGGMDSSLAGIFQTASAQAAEQFRQEQESITGSQEEERLTDGVRWKLQTLAMGGTPVSRWISPDFRWEGHFLYLTQKVQGQGAQSGLMAAMGKMLFRTSLKLYGFAPEMTPGLDHAALLTPLDPQLEPYFLAFTSDPAGARQILNPWVQMPLTAWAQKYPIRQGDSRQLAVLFGPQGVCLAIAGIVNAEFLDELTALGVELVKAQGGAR